VLTTLLSPALCNIYLCIVVACILVACSPHCYLFADIAGLASRYLVLCTPCLFLTTAMECTRRYLQAQRAVKPAMAVGESQLLLFIRWLRQQQHMQTQQQQQQQQMHNR
jgi:hypothetical protein